MHISTEPAHLSVYLRAADVLGDAAFGTLQLQLVDARTKLASAWTAIPGAFVRAPEVSAIECPADAAAPCTLLGTGLAAIAGVEDASGRFVAPSFDCTSDEKGMACRSVPHEKHYTLRLEDAQTVFVVPDAAIRGVSGEAGRRRDGSAGAGLVRIGAAERLDAKHVVDRRAVPAVAEICGAVRVVDQARPEHADAASARRAHARPHDAVAVRREDRSAESHRGP